MYLVEKYVFNYEQQEQQDITIIHYFPFCKERVYFGKFLL